MINPDLLSPPDVFDLMQCSRCNALHDNISGSCPDCNSSIVHQCSLHDNPEENTFEDIKNFYIQMADRLEKRAKRYKEWAKGYEILAKAK